MGSFRTPEDKNRSYFCYRLMTFANIVILRTHWRLGSEKTQQPVKCWFFDHPLGRLKREGCKTNTCLEGRCGSDEELPEKLEFAMLQCFEPTCPTCMMRSYASLSICQGPGQKQEQKKWHTLCYQLVHLKNWTYIFDGYMFKQELLTIP